MYTPSRDFYVINILWQYCFLQDWYCSREIVATWPSQRTRLSVCWNNIRSLQLVLDNISSPSVVNLHKLVQFLHQWKICLHAVRNVSRSLQIIRTYQIKHYQDNQTLNGRECSLWACWPLKMGTALQTVTGPRLAYCPKASSMYTNGMPQNISMMMYGMKKAPKSKICVLY